MIVTYNHTVITIINYDHKTFIVQATGKVVVRGFVTPSGILEFKKIFKNIATKITKILGENWHKLNKLVPYYKTFQQRI